MNLLELLGALGCIEKAAVALEIPRVLGSVRVCECRRQLEGFREGRFLVHCHDLELRAAVEDIQERQASVEGLVFVDDGLEGRIGGVLVGDAPFADLALRALVQRHVYGAELWPVRDQRSMGGLGGADSDIEATTRKPDHDEAIWPEYYTLRGAVVWNSC